MPAVNAVSLTGGTWLTADAGAALTDGRPSRAARIQRSGTVTLTASLATPIVPGVIALLGLNLAAGVNVTAAGASTTTHALPDGTTCAILLPTTTASTSSVAVKVSGSGLLHIGELIAMPAVDIPIEPGWATDLIDPSETTRDRGSQIATAARTPYRRLTAALQAQGASMLTLWHHLRHALTRDRRVIAIPRHTDPASRHLTAHYGTARLGPITHLGGNWFSSTLTLDELPAST